MVCGAANESAAPRVFTMNSRSETAVAIIQDRDIPAGGRLIDVGENPGEKVVIDVSGAEGRAVRSVELRELARHHAAHDGRRERRPRGAAVRVGIPVGVATVAALAATEPLGEALPQ